MRAVPVGSFAFRGDRRSREVRVKKPEPAAREPSKTGQCGRRPAHDPFMTDVLVLAILVAFFALAVLFVKACELIVGPDTAVSTTDAASDDAQGERTAA